MACKYVLAVAFARWLGASGFGVYIVASTWALLLAIPAGLGLTTGAIRFLPEYRARAQVPAAKGFVRRSQQLVLLAGAVIGVCASVLVLVVPERDLHETTFLVAMVSVPLYALLTLQQQIVRTTHLLGRALVGANIAHPALTLVLAGGVVVIGRASSTSFMWATVAALAIVIIAERLNVRDAAPEIREPVTPRFETRRWLRTGIPLLFSTSFGVILNYADILLLAILVDPVTAGIYAAATRTSTFSQIVATAVNLSGAPMASALSARKDRDGLAAMTATLTGWSFYGTLVVSVGIALVHPFVLGLFGSAFRAGATALLILLVAQLVDAWFGPVQSVLNMTDHHDDVAKAQGTAAVLNVVLNLALIPPFGLTGAAVATLLATALWNAWLMLVAKRRLGFVATPELPWRLLDRSRGRPQP